jgi:hypothetical protein
MRKKLTPFVALLVAGAVAAGLWWSGARIDRAIGRVLYGSDEERLESMGLLARHVDNDEAFGAITQWFETVVYGDPSAAIMAEAAKAFSKRKPAASGFSSAVATLQVRGLYPEARAWVDDYAQSAAITEALLQHLGTLQRGSWPGAEENLKRELAARPKTSVTLDLALAHWRKLRLVETARFVDTFNRAAIESRVKAAAATAAEGEAEWRLLDCQLRPCTGADVAHILNSARAEALGSNSNSGGASGHAYGMAAENDSLLPTRPEPLHAHKRALLSIGRAAVPGLLTLYADDSRTLWWFAASALVLLDEHALLSRLERDIAQNEDSALKALTALDATPADSERANRLFLEALSSKTADISARALDSLRTRLSDQELVDGVLGYVADRDRFSQGEVLAYENAIKRTGPKAGDYVGNTMTWMLDAAGDPRRVVWIQKVIAIHVLRDVGTPSEVAVLNRLRRDPGGYIWITTTITDGRRQESHRDVPFQVASDEAIEAITRRSGDS